MKRIQILFLALMLCFVVFVMSFRTQSRVEALNSNFKFSIAGGLPSDVNILVPSDYAITPYTWGAQPAKYSLNPLVPYEIQLLPKCNEKIENGVVTVTAPTSYKQWCWHRLGGYLWEYRGDGEIPFDDFVSDFPNLIWLMANEPNGNEDYGDPMSSIEYGRFVGYMAMRIANASGVTPKLVFCQTTTATVGSWDYCARAYAELKTFAQQNPNWPSGMPVASVIHAISTHNYVPSYDYQYCLDHGWTKNCYGFTLEPGYIEPKMDEWVSNMNQFAEFWEDTSNIYHSGDLANKPLWLTEFGTLFAFCNQYLEMQPGQDEVGGIGCAAKADRSPGSPDWTDDYVFYGRNHNEGIWGMQYRQIQYLLNPSDDPNLNQGDWTAAWFYQGYTGHGVNGRCNFTGWMFGDNTDCGTNQTQPSRAGRIYNETINCFIDNTATAYCPVAYGAHIITGKFNDDTTTDLILQQIDYNYRSFVLRSNGGGGYQNIQEITTLYGMHGGHWNDEVKNIIPGDFNGDGYTDLIIQQATSSYNSFLLLADGSGGFQNVQEVTNIVCANNNLCSNGTTAGDIWSAAKRTIITGDFNGDNRTDLLLKPLAYPDDAYLILANTSGGFQTTVKITTLYGTTAGHWAKNITPGDFNHDGRTDLLMQPLTNQHSSFLLLANSGPGAVFQVAQDVTSIVCANNNLCSNGTTAGDIWSAKTHHIVSGDFNGDGKTDLLLQQIAPVPYDARDRFTATYILYGASNGFQNVVPVTNSYGMTGNHWAGD